MNQKTQKYYSAPEDFGVFTCAEDYEEHQRLAAQGKWEPLEEEMP